MANSPPDALFVGGGVIGLAAAWRAAVAGMRVVVVDPDPGHGSTWAAAGMLAPVTEATYGEEPLVRLNLAAAAAWPSFAADLEAATGAAVGYRVDGTVVVGVDASDRAAIDEVTAFQQSLGLESRRLSASECRRMVPALDPAVSGGADVPGDHQVDNRQLVGALLAACANTGVTLMKHEVAHLLVTAATVEGVRLRDGRTLAAGAVVLAAGSASGSFPGLDPPALPPVRPVKGLTLRLSAPPGAPRLERTVRGLVHGVPCYLVPRGDGRLVVGATAEEKGFDRTVQAGDVHQLLRDARSLVPAVDEYAFEDATTGLRPGSPDNGPIVGAGALERLVLATGHYRSGILQAPLTAHAVVELLAGQAPSGPLAAFGPGRFDVARSAR